MPHILITRTLNDDSILKKTCEESGISLTGISFVEFTEVKNIEIPKADWVFFYSKQGFIHFIKIPGSDLYLNQAKIATIGTGTADLIEKSGYRVEFKGKGTPTGVADNFQKIAGNASILFPRAKYSEKSIQISLRHHARCFDIIVYSNNLIPTKLDFEPDVLIFTSPRNVLGYIQSNSIKPHQKVISIGPTTTTALNKINIKDVVESTSPDESSLTQLLLLNIN